MSNEIDDLMDLDPLSLSARDIDSIIAYHRANRAKAAAGIKPSKESGPKISLDEIMGKLGKKADAPVVRRR